LFQHTRSQTRHRLEILSIRNIRRYPQTDNPTTVPTRRRIRLLRGVALGPLSGYPVVFDTVRDVLLRDAADQRIARIAVGQQRADRQKDLGDGQRRRPVVLEDVEADGALAVDVAVVDARPERHLVCHARNNTALH